MRTGAFMKRKENGKWKWIFYAYLFLIVRLIVFKYPAQVLCRIAGQWDISTVTEGLKSANFTLFKTIRMYIRYYSRLNSFENLFGNILVFIPYGILYPLAFPSKKSRRFFVLVTLFLIIGVESFQLVSGFGKFDVDDILLNFMGAVLGITLKWIFDSFWNDFYDCGSGDKVIF